LYRRQFSAALELLTARNASSRELFDADKLLTIAQRQSGIAGLRIRDLPEVTVPVADLFP
jgi:hypothetical protein